MNLSETMLAIEQVLSAQSEQELASILAENPVLLEQETLETLMAMAQQAKQDGMVEVSEALQEAVNRIVAFVMNQVESAESQSSQPMSSFEPKVAWAIKARRHLALQKKELLDEAIAEAHGQDEIVAFLQAVADKNVPEIDRLEKQLIPKLQQTKRREETLTIILLTLNKTAGFAESYIQFPFELQKYSRELGIQACQQAIHIAQILNDKPCQAIYSGVLAIGFAESRQLREAENFYIQALQLYGVLAKKEPHIFNQYVALCCTI